MTTSLLQLCTCEKERNELKQKKIVHTKYRVTVYKIRVTQSNQLDFGLCFKILVVELTAT